MKFRRIYMKNKYFSDWTKLLKVYLDAGLINKNTTIIAHSIAPIFVSKFLVENKVLVKKLIIIGV